MDERIKRIEKQMVKYFKKDDYRHLKNHLKSGDIKSDEDYYLYVKSVIKTIRGLERLKKDPNYERDLENFIRYKKAEFGIK